MPLSYGGSLGSTGALGSKPHKGTQAKSQMRIEKLVQIDLSIGNGLIMSDEEIGRVLGCSVFHIKYLRKKQEYLQLRMELSTGISVRTEDAVKSFISIRKQAMHDMLPTALKVVADMLCNPGTPPALRAKMAIEVMDREGTHPKISRTDVHASVTHNYTGADGVSAEILAFMDAPSKDPNSVDPKILEALEANRAFSNSDTLSTSAQEEAMQKLEELPAKTSTIQ